MKDKIVLILIIVSLFFGCSDSSVEKRTIYYKNGGIEKIVPIKNEMKEGEAKFYYESGELEGIVNYKNDTLHGVSTLYYKSGIPRQVLIYKNGHLVDSALFYRNNGNLQEVHFYDSFGRMYDFHKFNKGGKRDTTVTSKEPLILTERNDTLFKSNEYRAVLRLGNQTGKKIFGIIGDFEEDTLLYTQKPNLNSLDNESIELVYLPKTKNDTIIKGIVLELFYNPKALMIHPFKHNIKGD